MYSLCINVSLEQYPFEVKFHVALLHMLVF